MTARQHIRLAYLATLVAVYYRGPHRGRHLVAALEFPSMWLAFVIAVHIAAPATRPAAAYTIPICAVICALAAFGEFIVLRFDAAAAAIAREQERARWQR